MNDLPGHRIIKLIGTVHGLTTCARKDTKSFLKSVGSGNEAKGLTHMLYNARDQAIERMVRDCISRGGNAIVGMGFGESEVLGFAQVSVYGTAVFVEREMKAEDRYTLKWQPNPFQDPAGERDSGISLWETRSIGLWTLYEHDELWLGGAEGCQREQAQQQLSDDSTWYGVYGRVRKRTAESFKGSNFFQLVSLFALR
jgi:uncharacterized protein YbjQ (UPF0145 family)